MPWGILINGSPALFLRETAGAADPPFASRSPFGLVSIRFADSAVKALWKSGINGFPPRVPPFIPFSTPLRSGLDSSGHPGSSTIVVSLLERNCMSNSFPKRNLPLRVVLNRVGEATLAQYAAARDPMDSPEVASQFWREVVAVDPCHEADKEHLVAVLLNAKLRMIGYHVVSVGSLNEALAHPREIFRAAILAGAYALILMHNHPSGDPSPSDADRRLTKNIREAACILQINLLDHVIVGSPGMGRPAYFSFREVGIL